MPEVVFKAAHAMVTTVVKVSRFCLIPPRLSSLCFQDEIIACFQFDDEIWPVLVDLAIEDIIYEVVGFLLSLYELFYDFCPLSKG
ncbi:MAG: hypothetical protein ACXQT4_04120 [Methanotrichaceae archaeon]